MAAGFRDKDGRAWSLRLDVPMQRRISNALGVNIMKISDGELLNRLGEDAMFLVDVLWICCAQQAQERGIDEDAFAAGFDGESIEAAGNALIEAIIDFFPPRRAAALRQLRDHAASQVEAAIDAVDQHLTSNAPSSRPQPSPASATSAAGVCEISPSPPKPDSEPTGPTHRA